MSEREEAARRFAEVMGWTLEPEDDELIFFDADWSGVASLPATDAPLPDHLAFVGRIAEEFNVSRKGRGPVHSLSIYVNEVDGQPIVKIGTPQGVESHQRGEGMAPDLSWAALLAGTAAKEGKHV